MCWAFLYPVVKHLLNEIDDLYNFSMRRFQIVDHSIVLEQPLKEPIVTADILYDIYNTSDIESLCNAWRIC